MKTTVRKSWTCYDAAEISRFNRQVQQDLGWLNRNWGFSLQPFMYDSDGNVQVTVEYWFQCPHDATLFSLKYL
jgi:hypothetical protein